MAGISESPHFSSQPDEGAAYEAGLKTAQDTVEKLNNSIQQLKAEIRAISDIIDLADNGLITVDFALLKRQLRELSAI
jgi:hypothetical protein